MKARRKARALALQALYEINCTGHPSAEVMAERLAADPVAEEVARFAGVLVDGVLAHCDTLDQFIHRYAPEWPLDQMALIDHNILRIAIWEFTIGRETPLKVAINEAVELAKLFGADSASRFVNGVLGALAAHEKELLQSVAAKAPPPHKPDANPAT